MDHDPASGPNLVYSAQDLDVGRLLGLLPNVATLDVCSAFLKSKGLRFSAIDWVEMRDKRFVEPLKDGSLKVEALAGLVHECEENSSKRIHLFQSRSGERHPIFDPEKRKAVLEKLTRWPEFGQRTVGRLSETPQIIEYREDRGLDMRRCIVIKVGTTQNRVALLDERSEDDGIKVLTYGPRAFPAINVVRLFEDGLLEVRMHQDKEIESYAGVTRAVWSMVEPLTAEADYYPRAIHSLLTKIWNPEERKTLSKQLGIAMSVHRNGRQTALEVRSGRPGSDLSGDLDALASVDRFNQQQGGDATGCRSAYIWVRADENSKDEERDLRIHVHGASNEFSVPSKCRKIDYERALAEILKATSGGERS